MGKQPFISHAVNGYSRYDVPESKAFSCTPGILYPVRVDFINARDRVTITQGIDVRSNPLAVPSFNPYTVRLHRFWVPMQLYHPEMRTNSSQFDMNDVSHNWLPVTIDPHDKVFLPGSGAYPNSLFAWLRFGFRNDLGNTPNFDEVPMGSGALVGWVNADSYLAYWDIVRNYYSYSQWGLYSFASPGSWYLSYGGSATNPTYTIQYAAASAYFTQLYGRLSFLDAYYESQFYPSAVTSTNNTYNRANLFLQIMHSNYNLTSDIGEGYPVVPVAFLNKTVTNCPKDQFSTGPVVDGPTDVKVFRPFVFAHPMAVAPSSPDRFSRLLPPGSSSDVSMTGVFTIPQLAVASRLQEYKDLLGAGGSRFSDWLETFFASRIEHVDRPKLLFSASQTVNVQVIMNTAGVNNFGTNGEPLGQQGGSIAFNSQLGRRQSYYFREPGYMIDMLSIRPVYYWSGIRPDYLSYMGSDYFNPIYNDIGYQGVPALRFSSNASPASSGYTVANEPCFNEFRSSYDEVLGSLCSFWGSVSTSGQQTPLYAYWVQQRSFIQTTILAGPTQYAPLLFVDLGSVNSPFISNVEDNFFVNLSYSVYKKNLVNKTFATRLSNR